jgi:hypothetical protein
MAGKWFIDIPNLDELAQKYLSGMSVAQLCEGTDIPRHTLRRRFVDMGIMRGKREGTRMAFETGRMANRRTRKGVPQSDAARARQSETMRRKADRTARGWRITSHGYVEYTRADDPNKGRMAHVVAMEAHIGRRLNRNECVHHIDGNKRNNDLSNLQLMTYAEHAALHRREEMEAGLARARRTNGTFEKGSVKCR